MTDKKDEYLNIQKRRCINYCMRKGMNVKEALEVAKEYERTGLEFPEELLVYNKLLK